MQNLKPSDKCGACKLYKEKCHCLCHVKDIVGEFHEILYEMPFPKPNLVQKIYNKLSRNNRI